MTVGEGGSEHRIGGGWAQPCSPQVPTDGWGWPGHTRGAPSLLLPSIQDAVGPFLGCPQSGSPQRRDAPGNAWGTQGERVLGPGWPQQVRAQGKSWDLRVGGSRRAPGAPRSLGRAGPCEAGLCRQVGEEAAFPAPQAGTLPVVTTSTVAGTVHSTAL